MEYGPNDSIIKSKEAEIELLLEQKNKILRDMSKITTALSIYIVDEENRVLIRKPSINIGDIIYEIDPPASQHGIIHCEVTRITYIEGYIFNVKSNGVS